MPVYWEIRSDWDYPNWEAEAIVIERTRAGAGAKQARPWRALRF